MERKTAISMLAIFIVAISVVSVAYAMWSGTLRANVTVKTGEVDWEIYNVNIWLDKCAYPINDYFWNATLGNYEQTNKDVGCTNVTLMDSDLDGDYDTMNVTIHNAYPWYYTHIAFKVHNDGSIPIKVWKIVVDGTEYFEIQPGQGILIDLNNDSKPDVQMWWGDSFGTQIEPCSSVDISFDLTVLQDAPENSTLTFTISFMAIQWNEYEENVPTTTTPGP